MWKLWTCTPQDGPRSCSQHDDCCAFCLLSKKCDVGRMITRNKWPSHVSTWSATTLTSVTDAALWILSRVGWKVSGCCKWSFIVLCQVFWSSRFRWNTLCLPGKWSAFRSWLPGMYGYGKLRVLNSTHAQWTQIYDITNLLVDTVTIVQEHHGPFAGASTWGTCRWLCSSLQCIVIQT